MQCVVTGNDRCITILSDTSNTITVTIDPTLAPKNFLPADTAKCDYETLSLKASANFSSYLWSNNSTASSIDVINPGTYWLEVTNINGCKGRDSMLVSPKTDCAAGIFVPTAFTPNNDGHNDLFGPVVYAPLKKFEFLIYNRWGQRIFYSTDPAKKWDGTLSQKDQNSSVFVWLLNYQPEGEEPRRMKGTVALIR